MKRSARIGWSLVTIAELLMPFPSTLLAFTTCCCPGASETELDACVPSLLRKVTVALAVALVEGLERI